MVVKKKKGFMVTMPVLPWLIVIVFAIILVVAILAILKTAALVSSDSNRVSSNALHAMLNSNECAPNTKLPFKDVLGAGMGEGIVSLRDPIKLEYGGITENVLLADCLTKLLGTVIPKDLKVFYVEYNACPQVNEGSISAKACYYYVSTDVGGAQYNVISAQYIALPNGDVARVVLRLGG